MKTRLYVLLIVLAISCLASNAQKFDSEKLIFGGDIGFGISSNYWNIGISPQVGYKLTDRFHVGAGVSYLHGQSKNDTYYDYNENSVGLNLFAHYHPWKKIVFRAKPEIMYTWYKFDWEFEAGSKVSKGKNTGDTFVPAVVVGAGLHLKPVMLLLNYELIQDNYSSYSDNVFLSVGFMF